MTKLRTFLLFLISTVLIIFAVSNRAPFDLDLWPLLNETISVPGFIVFFIGILVGIALSAVVLALRGVKHYTQMRSASKEKQKLSAEVEHLEQELDAKPPKVEQKDYTEEGPGIPKKIRGGGD